MNFQTLKDNVFEIVDECIDYGYDKLIWANGNGERPGLPYLTMMINSIVQVGQDDITEPNINGEVTFWNNREFMLQVQGFGEESIIEIERLYNNLKLEEIHVLAMSKDLYIIDIEPIQDITALLDNQYFEQRYSMDIRFRTASTQTESYEWSDKVNVDGDVKTV